MNMRSRWEYLGVQIAQSQIAWMYLSFSTEVLSTTPIRAVFWLESASQYLTAYANARLED